MIKSISEQQMAITIYFEESFRASTNGNITKTRIVINKNKGHTFIK